MYPLMFLISLIYVVIVFVVIQRIVRDIVLRAEGEVVQARQGFQKFIDKVQHSHAERKQLEGKASHIFTLYAMTKEITQNFNEEDAFHIFKSKFMESVSCAQCRLLGPSSEEIKALKTDEDYFLFALKGKGKLLGYLAIKGISPEDKEKAIISSHQFALALRRIRLYQEIEKSAITDSLTELYTRRYVLERLEEEIRRSKIQKIQLSLLMIDVDFFKKINDKHGHLTGDQILSGITGIIQDNIREIDIAGRYGGEEFCVVLPDTGRDGTHYVAERIRSAVEKTPFKVYDTIVKATVSIGVATFPDDGKVMTELIDKADWALYRAKKTGRNAVCVFGVYEEGRTNGASA